MADNFNRIGLGTFPLASVYNPITKEHAQGVIHAFMENGGYYIDTAPMYGSGSVETLLGEELKELSRDRFYIISKCGKSILPDKTVVKQASYSEVLKQCDESLQRLKLDYIDLYLIHSPDSITPYEETIKALKLLKEQGKIKEFGVSNVSFDQLKEYRKYADIRYVQNRFSFINRSISDEFLEYMEKNEIQFIPYHVLEIAQLTGTILETENLGVSDFRGTFNYFKAGPVSEIREWVRNYMLPIAKKYEYTIGQLAMTWVLQQPHIPFLIVGTTKNNYLTINMKSNSLNQPITMQKELEEAYNQLETQIFAKYKTSLKNFRGLNDRYY